MNEEKKHAAFLIAIAREMVRCGRLREEVLESTKFKQWEKWVEEKGIQEDGEEEDAGYPYGRNWEDY